MIEDYVVNGRDALVVSPRNPSELSGAIKTLLLDQPARERISKNGSTLACSNFTLENGINLISAEVQKIKKNNDFQK
jgi:glycosyltransferase involved in cell wall biosynthesis